MFWKEPESALPKEIAIPLDVWGRPYIQRPLQGHPVTLHAPRGLFIPTKASVRPQVLSCPRLSQHVPACSGARFAHDTQALVMEKKAHGVSLSLCPEAATEREIPKVTLLHPPH